MGCKKEAARIQPQYEPPYASELGTIAITMIAAALGLCAFRIMRRKRKREVEEIKLLFQNLSRTPESHILSKFIFVTDSLSGFTR